MTILDHAGTTAPSINSAGITVHTECRVALPQELQACRPTSNTTSTFQLPFTHLYLHRAFHHNPRHIPPHPVPRTLHTATQPRTYQTPPLPNDFVTSPDFHDCRVIFGHDLPKLVKSTAWSEKLGIAGCPIETLPMLAVTRHSWASYWLRNVCHGLETYPVYTRSVPQAMFISEILSRITHHRLDIDRIAMAHCQCAIPPIPHPTRKQAISALADEFYEYMSGLINDPPDSTAAAPDQLSNHRTTQLEQELAATKAVLQTRQSEIHPPSTPPTKRQAPPSPDQTPPPRPTPKHRKDFQFSPVKIHLHPF